MPSVTLHSLAELGEFFDLGATPTMAADEPDAAGDGAVDGPADVAWSTAEDAAIAAVPDLATLVDRLASAGAALASLLRADEEARAAAADLMARYEAAMDERRRAEAALGHARQVRAQAEALATGAFVDDNRAAAAEVLDVAALAEAEAERAMAARGREAEALATDPAIARLLDERRREERRRETEAAAADRARRLREGLAAAERSLAAGRLKEAGALLGSLAKEHPDSPDVSSLQSIIARRAQAVKCSAADDALRLARRAYRQAPRDAIARLEALDLAGLPEHLRHQIAGLWAAACARLCRERGAEEPRLRYVPQPGVGVVLAREAAGRPYVVVSALGAPFAAGAPVDDGFARRARPLRASGR